jgi:cytochrome c-type biogenesis protein
MNSGVSVLTAFTAGLFSFLSPCVLPLVSAYLLFISGNNLKGAEFPSYMDNTGKPGISKYHIHIIASTLCFVLGFTSVFIIMGILLYGVMFFLGGINRIINIASGVIIILFGLHILFNFIPFLNYEKRIQSEKNSSGPAGSFIVGIAFGAGWTPCVGPILGSILLMASQSGQMLLSIAYLTAYSLGLGVPFLLTAVFWGTFLKYLAKLKPLIPVIHIISGLFIIGIGLLMIFGRFILLSAFFLKNGYALAKWAAGNTVSVRLAPALFFLLIAVIPPLVRLTRKKTPFKPAVIIFSSLFLLLTVMNMLGVINCAAVFSKWLTFTGI